MVWAEDGMAGRMGSAMIRGNSVGGDGFIAEVNLFCDQGGSTYWDVCSRVKEECMEGWSWRRGVEGVRAGNAATTKVQRYEKENEVVGAKMRTNEVVTLGAETMSVDESDAGGVGGAGACALASVEEEVTEEEVVTFPPPKPKVKKRNERNEKKNEKTTVKTTAENGSYAALSASLTCVCSL